MHILVDYEGAWRPPVVGLLLAVQGQKLHHVGDAHSGLECNHQIKVQILF